MLACWSNCYRWSKCLRACLLVYLLVYLLAGVNVRDGANVKDVAMGQVIMVI